MPVPFEGKKRLYKPKSARDRKDAAFSSEAENLLFQEDGVSLRSDEILYEGRRDIFIYFFFFSPFSFSNDFRTRILNFPRFRELFRLRCLVHCSLRPIEKFLSIRRKLFPSSRVVSRITMHRIFPFFSFSFVLPFSSSWFVQFFKRKRLRYLYTKYKHVERIVERERERENKSLFHVFVQRVFSRWFIRSRSNFGGPLSQILIVKKWSVSPIRRQLQRGVWNRISHLGIWVDCVYRCATVECRWLFDTNLTYSASTVKEKRKKREKRKQRASVGEVIEKGWSGMSLWKIGKLRKHFRVKKIHVERSLKLVEKYKLFEFFRRR